MPVAVYEAGVIFAGLVAFPSGSVCGVGGRPGPLSSRQVDDHHHQIHELLISSDGWHVLAPATPHVDA